MRTSARLLVVTLVFAALACGLSAQDKGKPKDAVPAAANPISIKQCHSAPLGRWTPVFVGAVLILANWPYTLWAIMPTNHRLRAIAEDDAGSSSRALLQTWGWLHAVRTVLGVAATVALIPVIRDSSASG